MWTWTIILIALLAAPVIVPAFLMFVIAPIIIHHRQTLPIRPQYEPTRVEDLTPEMQEFLGNAVRAFNSEGFEVRANLHHPNAMKQMNSFQALLINPATSDMAWLIMIQSVQSRSLTFHITSKFSDDTSVQTASSRTPGVFPPDPTVDGANFPWVTSPAAVAEAHWRRLSRAGKANRKRIAPAPGQEIQYLLDDWTRNIQRFVKCGYKRLDERAGVCRFTWKGAFLGTWKMVGPIKRMRVALRDRNNRRLWVELGMEQWIQRVQPRPQPVLPLPPIIDERVRASDVHSTLRDEHLAYEAVLADGEIRREYQNGALTVRMGGPTTGQALAKNWGRLLGILFWLGVFGWFGLLALRFGLSPMWRFVPRWTIVWMLICLCICWVEISRLIRIIRRSRGVTIVSANRQGVRFTNVRTGRPNGEIPREQIEAVRVALHAGILRRTYRLEVRSFGKLRGQPLLTGPDKQVLNDVAQAIREAIGIDVPKTLAPQVTV